MSKKILYSFFFLLSFLYHSCSSNKVLSKTITYRYDNLSFLPQTLVKTLPESVEMSITPIDAKALNKETSDAAYRDGNYEKDFISVIEDWKVKVNSGTKAEKALYQGKINAFEYLSKLEGDNKILPEVAHLLKNKIANEASGRDGTEIETLGDGDSYRSDFNPYKVNRNYFSVFKVTFENKGPNLAKINLKDFQLNSNEELLYPLGSAYFEENLKGQAETIKNAYRLNMPQELTVTPNQRVTKYLAVPAINANNNNIKVQLLKNEKVVDFDFKMAKRELTKKYDFELFKLTYKGGGTSSYFRNYFAVVFKDNVSYALQTNQLYVSSDRKLMSASVYSIGINTGNSSVVFGRAEDFFFANVKGNIKEIEFEKMRK